MKEGGREKKKRDNGEEEGGNEMYVLIDTHTGERKGEEGRERNTVYQQAVTQANNIRNTHNTSHSPLLLSTTCVWDGVFI